MATFNVVDKQVDCKKTNPKVIDNVYIYRIFSVFRTFSAASYAMSMI